MEDGCVWPASEHGIFVDHNGFVYLGGSSANENPNGSAWSSTNGADGMILKFTKDGTFVMMIGGPGAKGPDSNNEELGRLGRSGREAGEFHWLHQVSLDSRGNIDTAEVDTGKRIQKFIRYGADGCSGTGRTTVGGVLR